MNRDNCDYMNTLVHKRRRSTHQHNYFTKHTIAVYLWSIISLALRLNYRKIRHVSLTSWVGYLPGVKQQPLTAIKMKEHLKKWKNRVNYIVSQPPKLWERAVRVYVYLHTFIPGIIMLPIMGMDKSHVCVSLLMFIPRSMIAG